MFNLAPKLMLLFFSQCSCFGHVLLTAVFFWITFSENEFLVFVGIIQLLLGAHRRSAESSG